MNRELSKKQLFISVASLIMAASLMIGIPAAGWMSRPQASDLEDTLETDLVAEIFPSQETELHQEENLIRRAVKKLEAQKSVDEILQAELEGGSYTFESPLTVLDPYGESPLTALVLFETEEPSQIEITIPGEDEDTGAVHIFEEASVRHTIPVYGLYPDTVNEVTLRQLSEAGEVIAENVVEIQTEPFPESLANYIILTESYGSSYEAGLNYMYQPLLFAFDKAGIPRWFLSDVDGQSYAKSYSDSRWLVPYGSVDEGDAIVFEMDRLGKIYRVFYTPYGVHHDLLTAPNGNLLITGSHGDTVEDLIVEIDTESGKIINTLDLKAVLQRTRFGSAQDWCHNNSIVWDESDGTIIISSNVQCTVAKLTWPEGKIKWLLSDPIEYMPRFQQYLLTPVGADFEYSYNQHHATVLPDYDNDPDTIDLLLFDNGRTRFDRDEELQRAIAANEIVAPENYSRLVHYRVNEKNMTVEQIWQYGKKRGEELFSWYRGSAQLLSNGNIIGFFDKQHDSVGDIAVSGNVVEIDDEDNLIWDAEVFTKGERGNFYGYRVFRYPIYFPDDQEHDLYTEGQNLIPQEVLNRNS